MADSANLLRSAVGRRGGLGTLNLIIRPANACNGNASVGKT